MNQWDFLSCGDNAFSEGHGTKSHAFFCPGLTSFSRFGRLSPARSGRDRISNEKQQHTKKRYEIY